MEIIMMAWLSERGLVMLESLLFTLMIHRSVTDGKLGNNSGPCRMFV